MPMAEERPSIRMHVHERDDLRVDGILRLLEAAAEPGPLSKVLQRMCRHAQTIAHADVVSVYVREQSDDGDHLVLRANVGFPEAAIGKVRLALGEGITGTAAEVMRPISASIAQEDEHYKHVPELGEERFPSLLAIPLMVRASVAGVLVMQRTEAAAFAETEVALGTALATTFSHALEHRGDASRAPSRSARLHGRKVIAGTALGRAQMLGTLEALRPRRPGAPTESELHIDRAFEDVANILRKAERRVVADMPPMGRGQLESLLLMLDDQRLRTIASERCTKHGMAAGLKQVAREYAVATYVSGAADPLLEQRAIEVENLCFLLATTANGLPLPSQGEVLVVAERLTAIAALTVVGGRASAVVASGPLQDDSLGVIVARAAGIPVLANIPGLFAWVRPDDTLLVDCGAEILRVNPPATTIARYRHMRESARPES
jgi:phosphotransferase system, enzyme I, PtsP